MSKSHLHGGDGFTIFHEKKLILVHKGINFLLLYVIGPFVKGFQCIPHIFRGLTMRDVMILINPKRGDENISCLEIVLDILFVFITTMGSWLVLCYTVAKNLRLKPPVGHDVPHVHIHRLDVNAHAFFPIGALL